MPSSPKLRQPFFWSALIAALMVAALCGLCIWGLAWHRGVPAGLGWDAIARGDQWFVSEVGPASPAAGKLLPGDEIVAINGSIRAARFGPPQALTAGSAPYAIEVLQDGTHRHFTFPIWQVPELSWMVWSYLLLAFVNLGLAVWIGSARPDYPAARVAFFLFLGGAVTFAAATLMDARPPLQGAALWLALLLGAPAWRPLEWAVVYDFSLRFPEPLPQPVFLRGVRVVLYSAGAVLCLLGILPILAQALNLDSRSALLPGFPLAAFDPWHPILADALGAAALLSAPLILARNYRRLPDAVSRRRLRWVALGISLAIVPMAVGVALRFLLQLLGYTQAAESVNSFLDTVASFVSLLAPLTVTYAIVKHRVLGIRFVIRRGLQYLLARNVLRLILYLPLIGIALDIALHPKVGIAEFLLHKAWWFNLLIIASAAVSLRYRTRLQNWVDRRFFRAAYEEEAILSKLIDCMQACETPDAVANAVAQQLQQTLQPSSVCVLFRNRSAGKFTVGYPHDSVLALHFRGLLNERMDDLLRSQRSSHSFAEMAPTADGQTAVSNEDVRNALITRITTGSGDLLGVLLLGEKKSEEPYSKRDQQLLQATATQIGLVLEMLALKDQVREEGRVRVEVLGRLDQEQIQLVLECPACGRCYTSPAAQCEDDQSPLGLTLPIERIIDGKYRLERRIGVGGMGAVYEASDLRLDRAVAVKVMTGRLFGNNAALRRFEREARAAARLEHPNIVAIYDFGSLRGDGAYLVMQLISGRSWRAELQGSGQIRPVRAASWFDQLCEAMTCAHTSGIVHRDLKPENVLVSDAGDVEKITVLDFGLAKFRSIQKLSEPSFTTEDTVLGTHGYMSPEQRSGEAVDERGDIYAMAVLTAECLTNSRPPTSGASRKWLRGVLRWPKSTPASSELLNLLIQCMADSPSQRVSSVQDLQRELIPLLRDCPPLMNVRAMSAGGSDDAMTMPLS